MTIYERQFKVYSAGITQLNSGKKFTQDFSNYGENFHIIKIKKYCYFYFVI
jgi:hypothetical protein